MDTVTIRVPGNLSDRVWHAMRQRWRISRSQTVDQALSFYLRLRERHPDLPLAPEQPHSLVGGHEVWVPTATAERCREVLRAHRRENPDAPRISLGALAQTALLHALSSLEAHGHVSV